MPSNDPEQMLSSMSDTAAASVEPQDDDVVDPRDVDRYLRPLPTPPWYRTPLMPPSCVVDQYTNNCRVPTPNPPLSPVAPTSSLSHAARRRHVIISVFITCMILLTMLLFLILLIRDMRRRRRRLADQQQEASLAMASQTVETIPEAERRSLMEAKLKLVKLEDIISARAAATLDNDDDDDRDDDHQHHTYSCSICLSDFVSGESISGSYNPDCQHLFHSECILQAFLVGQQRTKANEECCCPVCRRRFFVPDEAAVVMSSEET